MISSPFLLKVSLEAKHTVSFYFFPFWFSIKIHTFTEDYKLNVAMDKFWAQTSPRDRYAIKRKSWRPSKPANQLDYHSLLNNHLYINDALLFVPAFGTERIETKMLQVYNLARQQGVCFGLAHC